MRPITFSELSCPSCSGSCFEIRALKDEGLATVQCIECHRDYLLLDSENHWFDVIQGGYPKVSKCRCKSISFHIRCDYIYRDNGDVRSVDVFTTCASCKKTGKLLGLDIKYGDTDGLVTDPLKFCKNPKVLYDLQSLTLYTTRQDIADLISFLHTSHRCNFHASLLKDKRWAVQQPDVEEVKDAVLRGRKFDVPEQYLWLLASARILDIPHAAVDTLEAEDNFWKRNEVIHISSPFQMGLGKEETLLYYIKFSNEYVDNEVIIRKSDAFIGLTSSLLAWLKTHLVSWRGPRCFDNPDEHIRIFGDRFTKNRSGGN